MYRTKDPTPEEIEKSCAEIQSHWSEQQRRKRSIGNTKCAGYMIPIIRMRDFIDAIRDFGQNGRIFRD